MVQGSGSGAKVLDSRKYVGYAGCTDHMRTAWRCFPQAASKSLPLLT